MTSVRNHVATGADEIEDAVYSVIIVSYGHGETLMRAVRSSLACKPPPLEVIVVENGARDPETSPLDDLPAVRVLESSTNLGFAGGCNAGAAVAHAEWLLFVNPDVWVAPDLPRQLFVADCQQADIIGAQLLLPDSSTNAGDNPVHITGLSWSGRFGLPLEATRPRPVHAVSGACFAIRSQTFECLGGFDEDFFLYCEDTDLCLRALVHGYSVVFVPTAHATHDYSFEKGLNKWFFLERNRLTMLLTIPERRTLVRLAPAIAVMELAVLAASVQGGWSRQKMTAYSDLIRQRRSLRRRRATLQRTRTVPDKEVWCTFAWTIDSPILNGRGLGALNTMMRSYRRIAGWRQPSTRD
jgi:GT2 family glycosyltransferase